MLNIVYFLKQRFFLALLNRFLILNSFCVVEYRAMYRYEVLHEGDLAFEAGDLVAVLETQENGWCRGVRGEQEGWFPASYVQVSVMIHSKTKSFESRDCINYYKLNNL